MRAVYTHANEHADPDADAHAHLDAHADPDGHPVVHLYANAGTDADPHAHSNADEHAHVYPHAHAHVDAYDDTNTDADEHGYYYANAHGNSHAHGDPDPHEHSRRSRLLSGGFGKSACLRGTFDERLRARRDRVWGNVFGLRPVRHFHPHLHPYRDADGYPDAYVHPVAHIDTDIDADLGRERLLPTGVRRPPVLLWRTVGRGLPARSHPDLRSSMRCWCVHHVDPDDHADANCDSYADKHAHRVSDLWSELYGPRAEWSRGGPGQFRVRMHAKLAVRRRGRRRRHVRVL